VAGRKLWIWVRDHPLDEQELARRGINAAEELGRDDPLWPGQFAVLVALLLYLVLPPKLTIGPNWLLPSAEGVLLAALVLAIPRRRFVAHFRRTLALWYWELDRGGPLAPTDDRPVVAPDFLFPQMSDNRYAAPGWKPRFADYLYVSLTNQSAFSPTDTMPLRPRVRLLMGTQGVASLVTVGIIVARAVNILA
jgi:hypothetical protein